ncbi:zinc-dependent metalloprotease [Auraticoccus monumenti]|uniref:Putative hydrolase n=1 Tax=Auraticoccus monumenti TaxID=675864 RepID=A0A1G7ANC9_9ACTN|nr:zinc-dependent metalloprotease [Auraticoccus monumenti]SDE16369.1 putative hydrolase [Auraticoccus monumenti]
MADDQPRDGSDEEHDPRDEGRAGDGSSSGPTNPFEQLFGQLGGAGGGDMSQVMGQLQQMLSQMGMGSLLGGSGAAGSGVDWTQAKEMARRVVAGLGTDRTPTPADRQAVADAASIAQTWLDAATAFPAAEAALPTAWSRAEWIEGTMPVWQRLVQPVAESMADATAEAMMGSVGEAGADNPFAGMAEMLKPMLRSTGSTMFGVQLGQALGQLAAEVVGVTDIGVPLTDSSRIVLLPTNVEAFGEGLEESAGDVRLYLVLREAARQRLFADVAWLRPQLLALIEEYARHIRIDTSAIESAVAELDPSAMDPETLQQLSEQVRGELFEPQPTPEQKAVLERIETLLALVEGWVDEVAAQATAPWMPSAAALGETIRRNRATGGPAEQTFASLVGLELRPRRLRDAANLWAALREARGADGRDAVWQHPDLVPDAAALDDPIGFVRGETRSAEEPVDDFDAELAQLLDASQGEADPGETPEGEAPGGDDAGDDAGPEGPGTPDRG